MVQLFVVQVHLKPKNSLPGFFSMTWAQKKACPSYSLSPNLKKQPARVFSMTWAQKTTCPDFLPARILPFLPARVLPPVPGFYPCGPPGFYRPCPGFTFSQV